MRADPPTRPAATGSATARREAAAARQRRYATRAQAGVAVAAVEYDADPVDVLVEFRYLAEAQAGDRDAIGKAMGAALKSLLTR